MAKLKADVRKDILDGLNSGQHFFEVGRFFFVVNKDSVKVTHQEGESMVFNLDKVETRRHEHISANEDSSIYKYDSTTIKTIEGKVCKIMIPKLGRATISASKLSWLAEDNKSQLTIATIAAKGDYDRLKEAVDKGSNKFFQKSMKDMYAHYEDSYKRYYKQKNEENEKNRWYWKQHATWKTENGSLEYMFGDGKNKEYSIAKLESDVATKLEMVITFIDDISTFERYERFSNKGAQEFMSDFGYDCSCGDKFNVFDIKESFENSAKAITLPITEDEMDISEWCSNGISDGDDMVNLRLGLSPDDLLPVDIIENFKAYEYMKIGLIVEEQEHYYQYRMVEDGIYKFRKSSGETMTIEEFLEDTKYFKLAYEKQGD